MAWYDESITVLWHFGARNYGGRRGETERWYTNQCWPVWLECSALAENPSIFAKFRTCRYSM